MHLKSKINHWIYYAVMSVLDGTESAYAVGIYINTNTCGEKKLLRWNYISISIFSMILYPLA